MEIVNPVPPEELLGWSGSLQTTFLSPPNPQRVEQSAQHWRDRLEPDRTWGVRDRGRWVATLASDARTLTVPAAAGTTVAPVHALTGVTVSATHRRRGLLRSMLTGSLRGARDRGEAVSYLIAAEWPIYGRFGYGPATRQAHHTLYTRLPGGTVDGDLSGVRTIEPADLAELGPEVFARSRGLRAGEIDRLARQWQDQLADEPRAGRLNLLVHEGPDGPDGLLGWKPTRDFELGEGLGAVEVADLHAATPEAYRDLLAYLTGIDVVDEVRLAYRPVDEPGRFLLRDGRALRTTFAGDFTWVALVDVPAALTARGYRTAGRLVLDVVDESVTGYGAGRWLLEASPDGATCAATTATADLTLPVQALASAYLGDYPLAQTGQGYGVQEHTTGALATFDLLFGTALTPYCSTGF